jgi:hypothetical protein
MLWAKRIVLIFLYVMVMISIYPYPRTPLEERRYILASIPLGMMLVLGGMHTRR